METIRIFVENNYKKIILLYVVVLLVLFATTFLILKKSSVSDKLTNDQSVVECYKPIPGKWISIDENTDLSGGFICSKNIHPDYGIYTFDIKTQKQNNSDSYFMTDVSIYNGRALVQNIPIPFEQSSSIRFYPEQPVFNSFHLEDVNFDGYVDMRIKTDQGATGNMMYAFYLFNPKTGEFEYNADFSEKIGTYKIVGNTIITHSNGGRAGTIFGEGMYVVKDNKLVMIKSRGQSPSEADNDKLIYTEYELINGVMVEVKREDGRLDYAGDFW